MTWWGRNKKTANERRPQLMDGQDAYVFRRSRTLTGSISNQVATPATERAHLKTDRLKLHELRAHQQQVMKLFVGSMCVVALLGWLLANYISLPVVRAEQPSASQPALAAYQESIYTYFADHPLERFGYMLNAGELENYLRAKHVEISALTLEKAWYGGNVRFSVYFREPLLVWRAGSQQFYVDNQGVAFTYNHFAEPAVSVVDQSGLPPDSGGAVASARFVRFLGRMVGAVTSYNKGKITDVIIPASTRQIDLKIEGRPYSIKTHIDRDPLQQAEDINSALNYFDEKGIKPEYVDVRIPQKAFYK